MKRDWTEWPAGAFTFQEPVIAQQFVSSLYWPQHSNGLDEVFETDVFWE